MAQHTDSLFEQFVMPYNVEVGHHKVFENELNITPHNDISKITLTYISNKSSILITTLSQYPTTGRHEPTLLHSTAAEI